MTSNFNEEEIVQEISSRRVHVLQKFSDFEKNALKKRDLLVQTCQFLNFVKNAKEAEQNIGELIENVEKFEIKHSYDSLVKAKKLFSRWESEAILLQPTGLETNANRLIDEKNHASKRIENITASIRQRWQHLMSLLKNLIHDNEKEMETINFCQKCTNLLNWINEVKNIKIENKNNQELFDEIRKKSIIWNEILTQFKEFSPPTHQESEMFERTDEEWKAFQIFVNKLMRELDEKERIEQFRQNSEDICDWINEKEREMLDKLAEMEVEENMKYRKTIEIERKTVQQRINDLTNRMMNGTENDDEMKNEIEKTEHRFQLFEEFVDNWINELEKKSAIENLMKEANDVFNWSTEKMDQLIIMKESMSNDCDEIAINIETNVFDFNTWDKIVENMWQNLQTVLNRDIEEKNVKQVVEQSGEAYELVKTTSKDVNTMLEKRIEQLLIEDQIFQTHSKASHLMSLVNSEWNCKSSEDVEKLIRLNEELTPRCGSVVKMIENVQQEVKNEQDLSENSQRLFNELIEMKNKLAKCCEENQKVLQEKLDFFYLFDGSEELKNHANSMLTNLKMEFQKETRLKSSKNRINPIKEQLEKIVADYEATTTFETWADELRTKIEENINKIRETIDVLTREHEAQLDEYGVRRHVLNTEKFVERVEKWMEDSVEKLEEDQTDSALRHTNLKKVVTTCEQLISTGNDYKQSIEKRKNDIDNTSNEAMSLLDGIQKQLEGFCEQLWIRKEETEELIRDSDQMNELTGHNDWIRQKINAMKIEPSCDSLLSIQKLLRRYENDSEEIENRRKNINEIIIDVKKVEKQTSRRPHMKVVEEIEKNWNRMKMMFDEKGAVLESLAKLFEYDEEGTNVWEWIKEKMMFVDSIEKKEEEEINRLMIKKLTDSKSEVENFENKVLAAHKMLEMALTRPKSLNAKPFSQSFNKFRENLTKKQGGIESDYIGLKKMIDRKMALINQQLNETEVGREILETEKWVEDQENMLNRLFSKEEESIEFNDSKMDTNELAEKLDDVEMNLNRRRVNLTEIKCSNVKDSGQLGNFQKIDDAFSMLDVLSFEIDRMRQKLKRTNILKLLKTEMNDVIDSIQTCCENLKTKWKMTNEKLNGEIETLRRRVIGCLEKAKEIRSINADLAPIVYELEEKLEKEWNLLIERAEKRRKENESNRMLKEIENEIIDMEHWVDTLNEEVAIVTGGIHDSLEVQVALESIETWREELTRRFDQLQQVKGLIEQTGNLEENGDERQKPTSLVKRMEELSTDFENVEKAIDVKNENLLDLMDILEAERNCDRLLNWVLSKKKVLDDDLNNNQNVKVIMRRMSEIEKMMLNREEDLKKLKEFVGSLKHKTSSFEGAEIEEKFENLLEKWDELNEELMKKGVDFNESMSQMQVEEEFHKITEWIGKKVESITDVEETKIEKADLEKKKRKYETILSEIRDFQPIFEDFIQNEIIDSEKVSGIQIEWSVLIETITIRQNRLNDEIEKAKIRDKLESVDGWLTDVNEDLKTINLENLYKTEEAKSLMRKLAAINEQANEKSTILKNLSTNVLKGDESTRADIQIEQLHIELNKLKNDLKEIKEDLEMWNDLQEIIKLLDDEISWFKELSVIVSSSDVGHDSETLEMIERKHHRMMHELEKRKEKAINVINRTTELISMKKSRRPSLYAKHDEIADKMRQMTELIENVGQLCEIRQVRIEKWRKMFNLLNALKEKEQVIDEIEEVSKRWDGYGGYDIIGGEKMLVEIEVRIEIIEQVARAIEQLENEAKEISNDEMVRSKTAEHNVERLKLKIDELMSKLEKRHESITGKIEHVKFLWKCDREVQCIGDQEEKIVNLIRQKKTSLTFENAQYHSTVIFVEKYSAENVLKLKEMAKNMENVSGTGERAKALNIVVEKVERLKRELEMLAEKIENNVEKKERIQKLQDEYTRRASELTNWIEQAEEDVSDVVWFQTKQSSDECLETLLNILDKLNNEKLDDLKELELIEIELNELGEDVNLFTWHTFHSITVKYDRLAVTIKDRIRIVETQQARHLKNEKICEEAAEILEKCRNVLNATKKEVEKLPNLSMDAQKAKLCEMIEKLRRSGMTEELEKIRNVMDSRFIFENKFTKLTANNLLVDIWEYLEMMSSMLRSIEEMIADVNNSGITEKQLKEFELSFDYFDREKKGWLDYEKLELCLKSQGYEFIIVEQTIETMTMLDPTRCGKILKTDYMRWMIKNETTNVLNDRSAIEEALRSLDAQKLSDSMSRKEAEFFMSKIGSRTETVTEHVHLEYQDFVNSFY